ncbi:phosphoethanolamine transferase [Pseudoalteromonas tunicata]|uniref:phosphoethanolamine transferase n=1 Tax=Pseudoalteromonas tunicata TaxID=314281 RepID=UPI00273D573D|nr:phosphoethanolamine transferase [Pseudoalteromonas tunicata]MDP4985161.1 phosphoethanolamine transferase [Pseudoalteromonas tunicata]
MTLKKYFPTLFVLAAFYCFALLPEHIYHLLNSNYLATQSIKSSAISLVLMTVLAFCAQRLLVITLLTIFTLLQTGQLMYFHYFGGFYSAFDVMLLSKELTDALIGFLDVALFLMVPALLSLSFAGFAFWVYQRFHLQLPRSRYCGYALVLLLLLPLGQAFSVNSSQKFQPNISQSALKNGLFSFSYLIAYNSKTALGLLPPAKEYQAYQLSQHAPVDANIVVIMGESFSRYNLSLFDYERDTTPNLNALKDKPEFFYRPSLSSAVSTRVSLALFFNTVYEPDNMAHLQSMHTSLFKLAKHSGYNTHYITTQKNAGGLTYSFSLSDVDTWMDDDHLTDFEGQYDNRLLLALDKLKLDYQQPQFITLHMRSTHAPYVDNYPAEEAVYPVDKNDYQSYMRNSYDNSVHYTEKQIADIYQFFENTGRPTYIFFTSDHGELTGQSGRYGHNMVDLDIAQVPFLFYGPHLEQGAISNLAAELGCMPNHYHISKEIAKLLGFSIHNPNEVADTYYLNGTSVFGEAGYQQYTLSDLSDQWCASPSEHTK